MAAADRVSDVAGPFGPLDYLRLMRTSMPTYYLAGDIRVRAVRCLARAEMVPVHRMRIQGQIAVALFA